MTALWSNRPAVKARIVEVWQAATGSGGTLEGVGVSYGENPDGAPAAKAKVWLGNITGSMTRVGRASGRAARTDTYRISGHLKVWGRSSQQQADADAWAFMDAAVRLLLDGDRLGAGFESIEFDVTDQLDGPDPSEPAGNPAGSDLTFTIEARASVR